MNVTHVEANYTADRERVFEILSDHERFLSSRKMSCQLIREGKPTRNGLGAGRLVDAGSMKFTEDINEYDPPGAYEYRIVELGGWAGRMIPFHHEQGRIELTATSVGTRVDWTTRYRVAIPLLGGMLEWVIGRSLTGAFTGLLENARPQIEGDS